MCTEVCNSDRTVWTGLLAFLASDTSDLTGCCYCFALCSRTASYECLLFVWCKFNQVMRTFGDTFAAGLTCFAVNDCNTVYDMDRIKRTGFYTASESHTAVIAGFGSAARDKCHHFTVFYTGISVIVVCLFAGTGTFYKCSHAGGFYNFLSHDSCDHFADCFSAYRTGIDRCFAFCNRCCQTVATGISAATAIVSRKGFTNGNFTFICFNSKFLAGNAQENTDKEADGCNNYRCGNTCYNIQNDASLN